MGKIEKVFVKRPTVVVEQGERHLISLAGSIVTLERFWRDQCCDGGQQTVSLRTLQRQCQQGLIPGARSIGRKWYVCLPEWIGAPLRQPVLSGMETLRPIAQRNSEPIKGRAKAKLPKGHVGDGLDGFDPSVPVWAQAG